MTNLGQTLTAYTINAENHTHEDFLVELTIVIEPWIGILRKKNKK